MAGGEEITSSSLTSVKRRNDAVTAMCWSSNGRRVLLADERGGVKFSKSDGTRLKFLRLSTGYATCIRFMPETRNKSFVYCNQEGAVYIRDFEAGKVVESLPIVPIEKVLTSEEDPWAVYCLTKESEFLLYDVRSGESTKLQYRKPLQTTSFDVCQSRTQLIALGQSNGCIYTFDTRSSSKKLRTLCSVESAMSVEQNEEREVLNVRFNHAGTKLIMNDGYGMACQFDFTDLISDFRNNLCNFVVFEPTEPSKYHYKFKSKEVEEAKANIPNNPVRHKLIRKIISPFYISLSALKIKETKSYLKRRWPGDEWLALRAISQAYQIDKHNPSVHHLLIKSLVECDQLHYAQGYMNKFQDHPLYEIIDGRVSRLMPEIYDGLRENFRQILSVPVFKYIDYHQRYQGEGDHYAKCIDVQYLGNEERYIVSTTSDGQVNIHENHSAELKRNFREPKQPIKSILANPQKDLYLVNHHDGSISARQYP